MKTESYIDTDVNLLFFEHPVIWLQQIDYSVNTCTQ